VRCVCVPCNTGWMSALEDAVKPAVSAMMVGVAVPFAVPLQHVIAEWAMKTAMVWEFISPTNPVFYSDDERTALRLSSAIPPDTLMWLSQHTGREIFSTVVDQAKGAVAAHRVHGQITTIAFGQMVLQVVTIRRCGFSGRIGLDGDEQKWRDALLPLWPMWRGVITWPPRMSIADGALDDFHRRFGFGTPALTP
jgi:hypothetical protein